MQRAKVAGWTAAYGYLKEQSKWSAEMMKLPSIDAIGYDATMMLAAHYLSKHGPAVARRPLDYLATGLAGKVGYDFGVSGFKVKGLGGDGAIGGSLNPEDFDPDDDYGDDE
jgi:hypothetical protein